MPAYVGFYSAPLVCEAVPQIGCGCRAKPVLARLEQQSDIERAWLHRRGDVIAVEWRRELDVDQQVGLLRAAPRWRQRHCSRPRCIVIGRATTPLSMCLIPY